jgi:4-amino-4-deoxy-L-arabinose transferase-like glycosyltransferase
MVKAAGGATSHASSARHLAVMVRAAAVAIVLVAFFLRVWRLNEVPPGWRDDELIETLVVSQKALDGDWRVYYPDASGHEALYHLLNAGMLAAFGPNTIGIRLLSSFLGLLAVPLTYALGRRLFGPAVGLVAAAALAVSFWALMYSRVGIRHVALPPFVLASFLFFWLGLTRPPRHGWHPWLGAGLCLGLGFYTYFASRGVPLILAGFCLYLALFHRPALARRWTGPALLAGLALALALPLLITLSRQPGSETRVAEVGRPLAEARRGNLGPLWENTYRTLNMFHSDGDDEWLYNIPYRPLFGPVGALLFWLGALIALFLTLRPLIALITGRLGRDRPVGDWPPVLGGAFLFIWWLAGIAPGFLSVPAGSLSHTIVAQPAVYLLAALPVWAVARLGRPALLPLVVAATLLGTLGGRDLPDYFRVWPQRGNVRFLYRADIGNVADYLARQRQPADFAISGLLAGPWDREALKVELGEAGVNPAHFRPRWFNPERAALLQLGGEPATSFTGYPLVTDAYAAIYNPLPAEGTGGYHLSQVTAPPGLRPLADGDVCFGNGLCAVASRYDPVTGRLQLAWRVGRPLVLPPMPLISNPPPPGVYSGPRLYVFAHLLDAERSFLTGDDGLWVDASSLLPGDLFVQDHRLLGPANSQPALIAFGLYDPLTGERIATDDGRDHIALPLTQEAGP